MLLGVGVELCVGAGVVLVASPIEPIPGVPPVEAVLLWVELPPGADGVVAGGVTAFGPLPPVTVLGFVAVAELLGGGGGKQSLGIGDSLGVPLGVSEGILLGVLEGVSLGSITGVSELNGGV